METKEREFQEQRLLLKKIEEKCVLQALFVIPAVHQRRMLLVATNAGSIYV
jgi:hypothetical protein